MDHRDGHPAAVGGVGPQPVGAVAGRVVAAEHGLALAQGGVPGGQVGVVDGAGETSEDCSKRRLDERCSGFGPSQVTAGCSSDPTSQLPPSGSVPKGSSPSPPTGTTRRRSSASSRSDTTSHPSKTSTSSRRVPGRWSRTVRHRARVGASAGTATNRKSSASSLVTSRSQPRSGPAPARCSTAYSTPWRRGSTTRAGASGSSAGMTHASLVVLDWSVATTKARSLVQPTETVNRPSASSMTSTSSPGSVPSRWRQSW